MNSYMQQQLMEKEPKHLKESSGVAYGRHWKKSKEGENSVII